ncbi:DUF2892 domain-containing protein [bacterium]|nr:DUF2892 domain-containing protein [bacterium]
MNKKKPDQNVCGLDRVARVVMGVAAFALGVFRLFGGGYWGIVIIVAGGILIFSAITQFCGVYNVFGISTCPKKQE